MIKLHATRLLLLSACAGLGACSADSARFGDFYADAMPSPGIDYGTTAAVPSGTVGPPAIQGGRGVQGMPLANAPFPPHVTPQTVYRSAPDVGAARSVYPTYTPPSAPTTVASRSLPPVAAPASSGIVRDAVDSNPVPLPPRSATTGAVSSIAQRVRAALPKTSRPVAAPIENARAIVPNDVPALDRVTTAESRTPGWSGSGSSVTVREGETLYNLSKRFGIPVASIMAANDITDVRSVAAGRVLRIPTYNYDAKAPVSAPDADPDVRAARAARGMQGEPIGETIPQPATRRAGGNALPVQPVSVSREPVRQPVQAQAAIRPSGGGVTVAPGDTLYRIATRYGTSVDALRSANSLSNDSIRVGQVLTIPGANAVSTASAPPPPKRAAPVDPVRTASLDRVGQSPSVRSVEPAVAAAPRSLPRTNPTPDPVQQASAPAASSSDAMRWPVRGRVVQQFGGDSKGIEIAAPPGTAIHVAEGGKVLYAGSGLKELGKTVLVQHDNGLVTVYGYADDLRVAKGQTVSRGDVIASSGMTGKAKTPSVHFQVRKGSTPIDPSSYLN